MIFLCFAHFLAPLYANAFFPCVQLNARGSSGLVKEDVARLLIEEFGFIPIKPATIQPQVMANLRRKALKSDEYLALPLRAPVIAVMGHVDHGKTTLLDRLRSENRAGAEAGGITQAVGAFRVDLGTAEKDLAERPAFATFLDTPGHAAFKNMRAKGANSSCTDLIILVISAVDGLMPQSLEVIQLARKANLPLIVAINKCDVSGADPQAIQKQLVVHDVVVEEQGGEVLSCNISAKTGAGISELKELIAVTAEVLQLHADHNVPGEAYVLESRIHKGGGAVATVLVRNGSLKVGQYFVCGLQMGRIRALHDERDKPISHPIYPGESCQLFGFKALDDLTEDLYIVDNEELALRILAERQSLLEVDENELLSSVQAANQADQKAQAYKIQVTRRRKRVAIRPLTEEEQAAKKLVDNSVPVLVKADVNGSLEVLLDYFAKLPREEVLTSIIKASLGEITSADVQYASEVDGGASIFAFNVKPNAEAVLLAKQLGIKIYSHPVIYSLWDDIRDLLSEKLPSELEEGHVGQATVAQLFPLTDVKEKKKKAKAKAAQLPPPALTAGPLSPEEHQASIIAAQELDAPPMIAGCRVKIGKLDMKLHFRLRRDEEIILDKVNCVSLRVNKDAKPIVEKGSECGIRLGAHFDSAVRIGDIIECYEMRKKIKQIDDSAARGFMNEQGSVHQQAEFYE
jgi:translation initiation factor IF-2